MSKNNKHQVIHPTDLPNSTQHASVKFNAITNSNIGSKGMRKTSTILEIKAD